MWIEWMFDHPGWSTLGIILFVIGVACMAGIIEDRAQTYFMGQCLEDNRKEYECVAMWRAGNSQITTTNVPVFIPSYGK